MADQVDQRIGVTQRIEPERTALCIDFDGVLAPIVRDPELARPLPGTAALLGRLAERFAAVALVSGRPASFLATHAAAPGVRYFGQYGLEEVHDGKVTVDPRLAAATDAVRDATADLHDAAAIRDAGVYLEDKGGHAVAAHLRQIHDPERWAGPVEAAVREIAARHGLEVLPGRMVWELRPPVRSDKGDAVRRVVAAAGAEAAVMAGDDRGDLPAFAAVTELATAAGGSGLRVAVRSPETPAELLAAADLVVEGPEGVRAFLEDLLGAVA
jgi:trehalose 6-phosphate phosphatase